MSLINPKLEYVIYVSYTIFDAIPAMEKTSSVIIKALVNQMFEIWNVNN